MENKAEKTDMTEALAPTGRGDGVNADTVIQNADAKGGTGEDFVNDASFLDSDKGGGAIVSQKAPNGEKNEKQSREQNAEYARLRREKEKRELREKTIIETLRGRNPYTNEEMKDSADVEEYLTMREIDENGGDPVSDYSKYRKQKERDAEKARVEKAEQAEWYQNDRASFEAEYPDVDLNALVADEEFRLFAEGKVGVKSMSEIYAGWKRLTGRYDEKAKNIAAQMLANRNASPGALQSTQGTESDYFTPEQVRRMTPAEVRKNYENIRSSMLKWKN